MKSAHLYMAPILLMVLVNCGSSRQAQFYSLNTDSLLLPTEFSGKFIRLTPHEFNYIYHSPDSTDSVYYSTYPHLLHQQPTLENYEDYFRLGCSYWEFNKTSEAEKIFLNILASGEPFYADDYHHASDIPGDTTYSLYGYGSYTFNYKNRASLYLARIYIEQNKFDKALACLNDAVYKYKEVYTCGTGNAMQEERYRYFYARCYEGLDKRNELFDLLLPHCLNYYSETLVRTLKKTYSQKELKRYLIEAENSITSQTDTFPSLYCITSNYGDENEKVDTGWYYGGSGTIKLFGRVIDLPRPRLNNGEKLTRDYFVELFKGSEFYTSLARKKENGEELP